MIGRVLSCAARPGSPLATSTAASTTSAFTSTESAAMILETFPVGQLDCNCTIVGDEATGDAIVVDGATAWMKSCGDWRRAGCARFAGAYAAHIDHIADVGRLRELTGARGMLHRGTFRCIERWKCRLDG